MTRNNVVQIGFDDTELVTSPVDKITMISSLHFQNQNDQMNNNVVLKLYSAASDTSGIFNNFVLGPNEQFIFPRAIYLSPGDILLANAGNSQDNFTVCFVSSDYIEDTSSVNQFNFRGQYLPTITYNKMDVVHYNGSSYVAVNNGLVDILPTGPGWVLLVSSSLLDENSSILHNQLSDLQGGVQNENYHLTQNEYNNLTSETPNFNNLIILNDPTNINHAITKKYLDNQLSSVGDNVSHNNLNVLQGGSPNQYYHLTQNQHEAILNLLEDTSNFYNHNDLVNIQGGNTNQRYHLSQHHYNNITSAIPSFDSVNISQNPQTNSQVTNKKYVDEKITQELNSYDSNNYHNDLLSIQGGANNQYYHLSQEQYNNLNSVSPSFYNLKITQSVPNQDNDVITKAYLDTKVSQIVNNQASITNHNSLNSMQGGNNNERFHLSYNQYTNIISGTPSFDQFYINNTPTENNHVVTKLYLDNTISNNLNTNIDHNALNLLQGGDTNQYYHLNNSQYANLTAVNPSFSQLIISNNPTQNNQVATKDYVDSNINANTNNNNNFEVYHPGDTINLDVVNQNYFNVFIDILGYNSNINDGNTRLNLGLSSASSLDPGKNIEIYGHFFDNFYGTGLSHYLEIDGLGNNIAHYSNNTINYSNDKLVIQGFNNKSPSYIKLIFDGSMWNLFIGSIDIDNNTYSVVRVNNF